MRLSRGFISALVGTAITIVSWYGPWAWPAWPALSVIRLLFGTRLAFAELSYVIRAAVVVGLIVFNIGVWGIATFLVLISFGRFKRSYRTRT
jgi:hypothetical protein